MTVASSNNRNSHLGDCTTTQFSYTFRILDQTHLRVLVDCDVRTLTTHYTVSGVGSANGGTVTLVSAPNEGESVIIVRNVPITQETAYAEGSRFPATSHETALDKLTMIAQQHDEEIGRAIKLPTSSSLVDIDFPTPGASQFIRWNAGGSGLEVATITATGVATATLIGYTTSGIPSDLEAGTLFRVTDGVQDVRMAIAGGHHSVSGEVARVKAFQATAGDGSTECGAAFRSAHDGLPSTGGTILIDPGTYVVNPKWTNGSADCLIMCPITKKNVKIVGAGRDLVKITPIDGADNYVGFFVAETISPAGSETDVSGLELRGVTIDWNYAGNTLASSTPLKVSAAGGHVTRRLGIGARRASRVVVDSCRFVDLPRLGVWFIPNRTAATWECIKYITVSNNLIETSISESGFDDTDTENVEDPNFDLTAILLQGQHLTITNNYVRGRPTTYFLARTALSALGCNVFVSGNRVDKWYRGILVGMPDGATTTSENIIVTGNVITDANGGIQLSAIKTGNLGFQTSPGVRNVIISSNAIHTDKNRYARNTTDSDTPFGITTFRSNTLGLEDVIISNNSITHDEWLATNSGGAGIRIEAANCAVTIGCSRNIVIAHNVIRNSPLAGVYVNVPSFQCVRGLTIRGNVIDNPGTRQDSGNKQGIILQGGSVYHEVVIDGNVIRDTRSHVAGQTCTIDQGIRLAGGGAHCNSYVRHNMVSVPSCTGLVPVVTFATNDFVPYIEHVYGCGLHSAITSDAKFGSTILETTTGTRFVQNVWPQGATWSCTRSIQHEATLKTTDANATQIIGYPLDACTTYHARISVVATSGTQRASYVREATFYRNAGSATLLGAVTSVHTEESDNSWTVTVDANGNNLRIRGTGCSSDTVKWRARLDLTPVKED